MGSRGAALFLFRRMINPETTTPDYLVIGHTSKDLLPGGGAMLGGTATYSALTAQKLGLQAAVVTSCAGEDMGMLSPLREAGVWVKALPSPTTTSFSNLYDAAGHRTQIISAQASSIGLKDVPEAWRAARIVHLGPIAQEIEHNLPRAFTAGLLGITPQGWMRSWDAQGQVTQLAYPVPRVLESLPLNACLVLSIEDLNSNTRLIEDYLKLAGVTVITQGGDAAYVSQDGELRMVAALHARSIDPTGAGDVFAAAFFTLYAETADACRAARFAHAAAACAIEGKGIEAIASRWTVERRSKT